MLYCRDGVQFGVGFIQYHSRGPVVLLCRKSIAQCKMINSLKGLFDNHDRLCIPVFTVSAIVNEGSDFLAKRTE